MDGLEYRNRPMNEKVKAKISTSFSGYQSMSLALKGTNNGATKLINTKVEYYKSFPE